MSQYFLGVDGGQSGTTAIIGDENGRVLGVGRGGPSNQGGEAGFIQAIASTLREACAQAGFEAAKVNFSSACLGFSGGLGEKQPLLAQIFTSDRVVVTDDATVALSGALAGEPGVVVISGTGSIAFGRNAEGRTARAGGWGYLFGDEGGGFWIVREAMRAALRWEEGWGSPTALRSILLDATGARNMNDLMHRCYTPEFPRPRVAGLSLQVNTAAETGDPVARQILGDAARELGHFARAIRAQLFEDGETVQCAYVGGVFHSRILLAAFREALSGESALVPTAPIHEPAVGALLEAYRTAGVVPTKSVSRF
jgi:N-acetylglucosamine kinase-like BadF-type ATPase